MNTSVSNTLVSCAVKGPFLPNSENAWKHPNRNRAPSPKQNKANKNKQKTKTNKRKQKHKQKQTTKQTNKQKDGSEWTMLKKTRVFHETLDSAHSHVFETNETKQIS